MLIPHCTLFDTKKFMLFKAYLTWDSLRLFDRAQNTTVYCESLNISLTRPFAGKIGYGTFSEALSCKKAFIFVRRDHFNEEPFLRKMLEVQLTLI